MAISAVALASGPLSLDDNAYFSSSPEVFAPVLSTMLAVVYFGDTSEIYEPVADDVFLFEYFGDTSVVFRPILFSMDELLGEAICALPHDNVAYALEYCNTICGDA